MPKMPYFGIFGLEFKKTIVTFEIITLKFVSLKTLSKKLQCLSLGLKMPVWVFLG